MQSTGFVSASLLLRTLHWDAGRVERSLALLLREGMVWLDESRADTSSTSSAEPLYWFPSITLAV